MAHACEKACHQLCKAQDLIQRQFKCWLKTTNTATESWLGESITFIDISNLISYIFYLHVLFILAM